MSPSTPNSVSLTPLVFLERAAAVFPHREAIRFGDEVYNYAQFAEEAQHLARAIRARVSPGDRVAILASNIPQMLIAHFAVPLARAVLVTINTRLSPNEIAHILEHSGAAMLLASGEFSRVAEDAAARVPHGPDVITVSGGNREAYDDLLQDGANRAAVPWSVDDENAVIALNYTSGTTGNPKAVMYSHRGAYLNSMGFLHHAGFDADTRYLWTLPMFHCNGWCAPWSITAAAALHLCLEAVREEAVWAAIDAWDVTHLCGAPTVLSIVADAPQAHPLDRPLRMITGGAPPSPAMVSKVERLGISLTHVYGLTEVYGPYTICEYQPQWNTLDERERAERMARQGVAMIQSGGLRIVNDDLVDVPADGMTLGEVVMRGNNVMLGYFRDEAATELAFAGGWFHSGDLAVMHPDGYIEVKDRSKDLIISGGENISSIEVENALLSHPDVLDAAVVAVPHVKWGERPKAFVVARTESTVDAAELSAHLRSRLAGFKIPDSVEFLVELPRTSTGKILKRELRDSAMSPPSVPG